MLGHPQGLVAAFLKRTGKLAHYVKVMPGYAPHMGAAMGLIAPHRHPPDLAAVQPELAATASPGVQPLLKWKRGRLPSVQIFADHGDGKFVLMTLHLGSRYTDRTPLPPPGIAVVWRYKAIYYKDDAQIGQWSKTVSVTVTG